MPPPPKKGTGRVIDVTNAQFEVLKLAFEIF